MRSARSLTVSRSIQWEGPWMQSPPWMQASLDADPVDVAPRGQNDRHV